jgi:hypothetical protein
MLSTSLIPKVAAELQPEHANKMAFLCGLRALARA